MVIALLLPIFQDEPSHPLSRLKRNQEGNYMKKQFPQKRARGFTLIEIMVVVVILGILAATIIPQFIGTTHDAKVSAAKSNIAELEAALERFNIHLDERRPLKKD